LVRFHYLKKNGVVSFYTRTDASLHPVISLYFKSCDFNIYGDELTAEGRSIVVCDDPFAVLLAKLKFPRSKIIFFALEIFESQRGFGIINRVKNLIYYFSNRMAHLTSNIIIYPSNQRLKHYEIVGWSRKNISHLVFQNLPIIYDDENSIKSKSDELFKNIHLNLSRDKILIVFAGALGEDRGLEFINKISKISFVELHIFSNYSKPILLNDNVRFHGNLSRIKLLSLYKFFDIGLLSYNNFPLNVKYSAPVKIWEYAESNMVIIGNENYSLCNEYFNMIDFIAKDDNGLEKFMLNLLQEKKNFGCIKRHRSKMVGELRMQQIEIFNKVVKNLLISS
jgi:hypothetical protein